MTIPIVELGTTILNCLSTSPGSPSSSSRCFISFMSSLTTSEMASFDPLIRLTRSCQNILD